MRDLPRKYYEAAGLNGCPPLAAVGAVDFEEEPLPRGERGEGAARVVGGELRLRGRVAAVVRRIARRHGERRRLWLRRRRHRGPHCHTTFPAAAFLGGSTAASITQGGGITCSLLVAYVGMLQLVAGRRFSRGYSVVR